MKALQDAFGNKINLNELCLMPLSRNRFDIVVVDGIGQNNEYAQVQYNSLNVFGLHHKKSSSKSLLENYQGFTLNNWLSCSSFDDIVRDIKDHCCVIEEKMSGIDESKKPSTD